MSRLSTGKCPAPVRAQRQHRRRLGMERLEERRLLTLAEFQFQFYEDAGGVPGALLSSPTVEAGDTFFVEIVAEDVQDKPLGLHGISLDVLWDPAVFSVADPFDPAAVITDKLPLFSVGTLEADIGRINDLGGSAGLGWGVGSLVGKEGPDRFALIRFQTLQPSEGARFSLRGGKHDIAFYPPIWDQPSDFYFDQERVKVVIPAPAAVPPATVPPAAVSPAAVSPATVPPAAVPPAASPPAASPPAASAPAVIPPAAPIPDPDDSAPGDPSAVTPEPEVIPPLPPAIETSLPEPPPPAVVIEDSPSSDETAVVMPSEPVETDHAVPAETAVATPIHGPARFLVIDLTRGEMHVVLDAPPGLGSAGGPGGVVTSAPQQVPRVLGPLPLVATAAGRTAASPLSGWQRSVEALFQSHWLLPLNVADQDDGDDEPENILDLLAADTHDHLRCDH